MTAPTPSSPGSDRPQQYDPWATRGPGGPHGFGGSSGSGGSYGSGAYGHGGPTPSSGPGPGDGLHVRREVRDALLVSLVVGLLGLVLGLLWLWLAPRVPLVSDGKAVFLKHPEGEEAFGADGTFVLLGMAIGAVAGAGMFLRRPEGGVGRVVGLALGGVLASLLAWRLGVWLGPTGDLAAHAKAVGKGTVFDGPLELHAKGALLACSFAAVTAHLVLTAAFGPRDPEPPSPYGPQPPLR